MFSRSLNRKYSYHGRSASDVAGRLDEETHSRNETLPQAVKCKMSKFCHECGLRFPESAKFCCECGVRRLALWNSYDRRSRRRRRRHRIVDFRRKVKSNEEKVVRCPKGAARTKRSRVFWKLDSEYFFCQREKDILLYFDILKSFGIHRECFMNILWRSIPVLENVFRGSSCECTLQKKKAEKF